MSLRKSCKFRDCRILLGKLKCSSKTNSCKAQNRVWTKWNGIWEVLKGHRRLWRRECTQTFRYQGKSGKSLPNFRQWSDHLLACPETFRRRVILWECGVLASKNSSKKQVVIFTRLWKVPRLRLVMHLPKISSIERLILCRSHRMILQQTWKSTEQRKAFCKMCRRVRIQSRQKFQWSTRPSEPWIFNRMHLRLSTAPTAPAP